MVKKLTAILAICGTAFGGELEQATEFLKDLINNDNMADYKYLEEHCSKKVLDMLEETYDYICYEPPCYGMWMFRVGLNGTETHNVVNVADDGDGWFTYTVQEDDTTAKRSVQLKFDNDKITIDDFKKL